MRYIIIFLLLSSSAFAQEITFEELLDKAFLGAVELEIAKTDEFIMDMSRWEAHSRLFPTAYYSFDSNYVYDYKEERMTGLFVYDDDTSVQISSYIGAEYTINGGVDYTNYQIAKLRLESQRHQTNTIKKNLALQLVDLYEQLLTSYHGMKMYEDMSLTALELYNAQKRLHEAGLAGKQDHYHTGAEAADYATQKIRYEQSFASTLDSITYFTDEEYSPDLIPADFTPTNAAVNLSYEAYPEYKALLLSMEEKDKEISALYRSQIPTVRLYARYGRLGTHDSRWGLALNDMKWNTSQIGFEVNYTFFQGFSVVHTHSRLKAEKMKLELERQQLVRSINAEITRLQDAQAYLGRTYEHTRQAESYVNEAFAMDQSLRDANLTGAVDIYIQRIDTLEKVLEQKLININMQADAMRLEITGRYAR